MLWCCIVRSRTIKLTRIFINSHYGPGFFGFFQQQNDKIANGSIKEEAAQYLHLDTLGIVNGLIDLVVQGESLISYPYDNVSILEARVAVGYGTKKNRIKLKLRETQILELRSASLQPVPLRGNAAQLDEAQWLQGPTLSVPGGPKRPWSSLPLPREAKLFRGLR